MRVRVRVSTSTWPTKCSFSTGVAAAAFTPTWWCTTRFAYGVRTVVPPSGQAALRLRYVQHAGGWYA